ncbi:YesL family protein [Bacillus suaedae]|uniref:YesL family protein n=1 Tax=Halalkalibacter suaedae TaxID=2822140 RepID=A0A941AQ76_9BACI|nr:YesL family protein [Bacillus suaedae]MBP3953590.1 YesL family protein [Bacillus suaedae]
MNQIVGKVDGILRWVTRIAYVNILWLVFTLLGLVAFGLFPATTAMLSISRKWLAGEVDFPYFKTFARAFKADFIKANGLGWILTVIGGILFLNYQLLQSGTEFHISVIFAFYLFVFLYTVVVLNVFPIFVHFKAPLFVHFRSALIIGLIHFHITLAMMLVLIAMIYIASSYPTVVLFFSGSLLATSYMWLIFKSIDRVEAKKEKLSATA